MTRDEFDAVFEIFADKHELPPKVIEALRKACNSRWPEIAQLEDAQELFKYLVKLGAMVVRQIREKKEEKGIIAGFIALFIYPWRGLSIEIAAEEMTPELNSKLEAVFEALPPVLSAHFKAHGIDLEEEIDRLIDPEEVEIFKRLISTIPGIEGLEGQENQDERR